MIKHLGGFKAIELAVRNDIVTRIMGGERTELRSLFSFYKIYAPSRTNRQGRSMEFMQHAGRHNWTANIYLLDGGEGLLASYDRLKREIRLNTEANHTLIKIIERTLHDWLPDNYIITLMPLTNEGNTGRITTTSAYDTVFINEPVSWTRNVPF